MYTSMVAILVWVKCMKSKANNTQARAADRLSFVSRLANRYTAGTMRIPKKVPAMRQPKGFMPNKATPAAMKILPMGGWVFS